MDFPDEWLSALSRPAVRDFVQKNYDRDSYALSLGSPTVDGVSMRLVAQQIKSVQKAVSKLPEWSQCPALVFPPPGNLEQASSELTARYKASIIRGESLVDLTGGTGIDCYYLSSSFEQTTYVEQEFGLCSLATHNFNALGCRIRVIHSTAEAYVKKHPAPSAYFIDPSRRDAHQKRLYRMQDCAPDVRTLMDYIPESAQLLVKLSPMLDIRQAVSDLSGRVSEIHITAVENEVKELLLLCGPPCNNPLIRAVNLHRRNENQVFSFTWKDEKEATPTLGACKSYLYEANAAIRKSGAFNFLATHFGLEKLGINTHLYTSAALVTGFPGRLIAVTWDIPYQPRKIRKQMGIETANIQVRNFPEEVPKIRKKTGLKDGGEYYLFFYRDINDHLRVAGGPKYTSSQPVEREL